MTRVLERTDGVGGVLAVALACWLIGANLVSGGSSVRPVVLVVAVALAYVLGRLLARWHPFASAAAVVVATLAAFAFAWPDVIGREPLAGPLGYQNANAALAVQAFVAACAVAVARGTSTRLRSLALVVAIPLLVVPILVGATAATAGAVLVVAAGSWTIVRPAPRIAALLQAGFALIVIATIIAGAIYAGRNGETDRGTPNTAVDTRLSLWADALHLMVAHPIAGVGSGRFADESPTARADPDRRYAHEEFLQAGAETGVVGGVLVLALFFWAIGSTGARGTRAAAVVAAGVAALGVHASVDYVLHFPIIPIAAAVLVGGVLADRHDELGSPDARDEEEEAR